MSRLPNRRDDEVRRLLDTPHPVVPVDLAARAMTRGRRIVRRRRVVRLAVTALALAALVAAIVLAVLYWPDDDPATTTPNGNWWSALG
ncbi:hypothetical protein ABZ901_31390 [Actinacidiphila alni]|uniref:hypothetical protein n=1 Tax=Actinacidiphila alni TaxID=380248 RepID=UPI0034049AB7